MSIEPARCAVDGVMSSLYPSEWVTRFPYTWMVVMVAAALFGHVLLARRLRADAKAGPAAAS